MSNLILVKQLPIIEEQLKALGAEIDKELTEAKSLVCTEETVKAVKATRARFNKQFQELEEQRKAAKSAVLAPYEAFELVYKEHVSSKYKDADGKLKAIIDNTEDGLKLKKTDEIKTYFAEYIASALIGWLKFDDVGLNVTLNASLKSLREQVKAFVDKVNEELAVIEIHEHRDEVLVEYKASLSLTKSVAVVSERHKALDQAAALRAEREAKKLAEQELVKVVEAAAPVVFAPPVIVPAPLAAEPKKQEDDPVLKLSFAVTATLSKLKEVKKFLDDGGYTYE